MKDLLLVVAGGVIVWMLMKGGNLASLIPQAPVSMSVPATGALDKFVGALNASVPEARPPALGAIQPQSAPVAPVAQPAQQAAPTPAAPPANIKSPDYPQVAGQLTPLPGGGVVSIAVFDPQGQKAQQVAGALQMGNPNFWTVGTIENGGGDAKVFTPAGWLSCTAMKNVNQFDGSQDLQEWFFAMPPDARGKAVAACRAAGR